MSGFTKIGEPKVIVVSLVARAAFALGRFVQLDLTQATFADRFSSVVEAVQDNPHVCGVALDAALAAGDVVRVQVQGPLATGTARMTNGVTIGQPVVVNTTDGTGSLQVAADVLPTVAVALDTSAGATGGIYLLNPMKLGD